MARVPVPRQLSDEELRHLDPHDPAQRAAVLAQSPDSLWLAGHHVLAQALDNFVEFRHQTPVLTYKQICQAVELRRALGLPDA